MSSRVLLYILYTCFFLFILNIWGYYGSTTYREFLATLKYGSSVMITDEIPNPPKKDTGSTLPLSPKIGTGRIDAKTSTGKIQEKPLVLTAIEEKMVDAFGSYALKKLLVHPSLFDLTTEYPDEYLEYYSEPVTLYVFPTKDFTGVTDIFEAMATELPFVLNKANTLGSQSFFLNVKPEFQDGYVRVVFEYNQKVFGLKIQKDRYNTVKGIIKNIK